jgi:hypothetical protein
MLSGPTVTETASGLFIDLADPDPSLFKIEDIAWTLSRINRFGGSSSTPVPYTVAQHTAEVSRYCERVFQDGTFERRHFLKDLSEGIFAAGIESEKAKFLFDMEAFVTDPKIQADVSQVSAVAFHGLMHDFAEAYLSDLPTPVKRLPGVYEAYKAHELKFDMLIYETFGLPYSGGKWPESFRRSQFIVGWADVYALQIEAWHGMPSRGRDWGAFPEHRQLSLDEVMTYPPILTGIDAYKQLVDRFKYLQHRVKMAYDMGYAATFSLTPSHPE